MRKTGAKSAQSAQSAGLAGARSADMGRAQAAGMGGAQSADKGKNVDGRRADDVSVSVDDGNAIRQCVGLGDKDSVSVSGQRMGFGASMDDKGCVVLKRVTNTILRSNTAARTSPSRMRSLGSSTTSPWRGVGAGSKTIGRTTAMAQGSKGSSKTQRNVVASKVGNLIAMHHGLIREQTNRGVEPDQWPSSRYNREQGANGSQGSRPGSQWDESRES